MNNTLHTPSPWSVKKASPQAGIIIAPNRSLGIAEVFGGGETDIANAHLISAAPDLLSALESAYNAIAWDIPGGNLSDEEEETLLDVIREAIRKAKGEA